MKRVVSVIMVSILALSMVLIGGPTAFAGESGGFSYEISNDQATITKYFGEGGNVVIPNTLGGYPVTVIGGGAFFKSNLTSVTIPNTVTSIEGDDSVGGAFELCKELTSVSIPNSVTKIGTRAFESCEGLPGITIPNSVTSIGVHAFEDCISLPSITIPNSVKSIGAGAFTLCKGLTQFIVDENNVAYSTQQGALLNKTKTSLISFPGGQKGDYVIPSTVANIGAEAFSWCGGITNVSIPDSVTSIGYSAFDSSSIDSISIGNSVISIGSCAFLSCAALASVTIPDSVTSIGYGAFGNCRSLTEINVGDKNSSYSSQDGVLFNKTKTCLIQYSSGKVGSYIIPNGVTSIGDESPITDEIFYGNGAFDGCVGLTDVTIPNSVTKINLLTFNNCTGLTNVTIPNSVTFMGGYIFWHCTGLNSVTIGSGVTRVNNTVFSSCYALTSVYFLGKAPTMDDGVFKDCAPALKLYYLKNSTGFTSPTWLGYPSAIFTHAPDPASVPENDGNPSASNVQRLFGQNRIDTALAIGKATYPDKVANVILATADNYPDALAGSVLAYKLNAPILLVGSSDADQEKVLNYMNSNLDPEGTVYILGGTAVVSSAMEGKVTACGFTKITRLGGTGRYETSAKIADQLGVKTGTSVVLVSGENYPDALSISSIAAEMQNPILLVQKDSLSDAVKQEIAAIKPTKVYIIGGEGVISATVANQVTMLVGLAQTNIERIGGIDRYATSLAVAQYFKLTGNVCVATGNNFPDALAGSVYAANHNASIILADGSLSDQVINYLKTKKLTGATLFGGEAVIGKGIEQQLGQLIGQ